MSIGRDDGSVGGHPAPPPSKLSAAPRVEASTTCAPDRRLATLRQAEAPPRHLEARMKTARSIALATLLAASALGSATCNGGSRLPLDSDEAQALLSGMIEMAHGVEEEVRIPMISITCSSRFRSRVPGDSDRPFRRIPITLVRRRSAAVLEARFMGLKSRGWRGSWSSAGAVVGGRGTGGGRFSGGVEVGRRGSDALHGALGDRFGSRAGPFGSDRGDSDPSGLAGTDVRTATRPAESLLCVPSPPILGREVP